MKKQKNEAQNHILVAPSILSANFGYLADEVKSAEEAGADMIHLDVMDGHFVRNLTMGTQVVSAVNRATDLFLDVHLMIYNPYEYIERFVEAGADCITIHFEATEDVRETLDYIRKCNIKAGLAFNPETSPSMIPKYLESCDKILLMTVNPGFGGQAFMPEVLEKIAFTRELCDKLNIRSGGVCQANLPPFDIQVDGGITLENAHLCVEAGANILVAGTTIYHSKNMKETIHQLHTCASRGL